MAQLARALMRDFPHRYHYFDDERFRYRGREHRTPNKLLGRYRGMDGIKTGYIRASGFNLVASAERDGRRVIAVVFGGKTSRSRNSHMANLLDLGFTRIAERDAARGRVRYAGIPRPPAGSGLAAPTPPPSSPRHSWLRRPSCPNWPKVPRRLRPSRSRVPRRCGPDVASGPPPPSPPPSKPGVVAPTVAKATVASGTKSPANTFEADPVTARPWGIQVGAYESITAAQIAMRRATARAPSLNGATAALEPSAVGPGNLYRARFLGLYKSDAKRACKVLRAAPMPCVIIRGLDPAHDPAASIPS